MNEARLPSERIEWIGAIAVDRALPPAAHHVAGFVAWAWDSKAGVFQWSADRLASEIGIARSTVQAAVYALAREGWLTAARGPSKGRTATQYRLTFKGSTASLGGLLGYEATARPTGLLDAQPPGESGGSRVQPPDQPPEHRCDNPGYPEERIHTGADAPVAEVVEQEIGPTFPLKGSGTWRITVTDFQKLERAYPQVDLATEFNRAALWCESRPGKRKTRGGMLRFVTGWLNRSSPTPQRTPEIEHDGLPISEEARAAIARAEAGLPRDANGRPLPLFAGYQDTAEATP